MIQKVFYLTGINYLNFRMVYGSLRAFLSYCTVFIAGLARWLKKHFLFLRKILRRKILLLLLSAVDGVGAVFCPWIGWRQTGGRPLVPQRTWWDRPQQVTSCWSARRPLRAIHRPVLTGTGHHPGSVPCSVPDSGAADNAANIQRLSTPCDYVQ